MNKDSHLIFESYIDNLSKTKKEIGSNIMRMVKYGLPDESKIPELKNQLISIFKDIKKAGGHVTPEQSENAKMLINQLRNSGMPEEELRNLYRQAPTEDCEDYTAQDYANEMERKGIGQKISGEDAEGGLANGMCVEDLAKKHGVSLEEIQHQLEQGIKTEMEHTDNMDVATKIAMDHLAEDPHYYTKLAKMEKGENAEDSAEDKMKNRENERDEKQRDAEISSAFHYDPMSGLAKAANQIRDILQGAANDEARTEHIIKMAQIILGNPKEHNPAEYRKMLDGLIVLLNRFIVVPMNEYEEMPAKQFMDLKKHINKGPIQIKKPSKELHPTNPKIHDLAKKDSREEGSESKVHPAEKKYGEQLNARKKMELSFKNWLNKKRSEGKAKNYPQKAPYEVRQHWKKKEENEERRIDPKCWKGYHKQGTKLKGGKRVNNCVKNS